MRTIGYCEKCRRIRSVRVLRWTQTQLAIGICQSCEDEKKADMDKRHAR